MKSKITQKDGLKLSTALDALALALAGHKHKWTAKQRSAYERAVSVLGKTFAGEVPPPRRRNTQEHRRLYSERP
jgi:hypothetical protein